MDSRMRIAVVIIAVTTAACGRDGRPSPSVDCTEKGRRAVAESDEIPGDLTFAQYTQAVLRTYTATLLWARADETALEIRVSRGPGEAVYVDREGFVTIDDSEADCEDFVDVPVELQVTTADGALAETWSGVLKYKQISGTHFEREMAPDAFNGTYTLTELDPTHYDSVLVHFDMRIFDNTHLGAMWATGQKRLPDSGVFVNRERIATW
jgi:hypothetical protein